VRGETAGLLSLTQSATGGDGTQIGGDASSRLDESASSQKLTLSSTAVGGNLENFAPSTAATRGGNALAEADGSNDQGDATVRSFATGRRNTFGQAGGSEASATSTTLGATPHYAQAIASAGTNLDIGYPPQAGGALAGSTATSTGNAFAMSTAYASTLQGGLNADGTARSTARSGVNFFANAKSFAVGQATTMLADSTASAGTPGSQAFSDVHTQRHVLFDLSAHVTEGVATASTLRTVSRVGDPESLSDAVTRLLPESSSVGGYVSGVDEGGSSWVAGNPNVLGSLGTAGSVLAQGLVGSNAGGGDWSVAETFKLDTSMSGHFQADAFRIGFLDPSFPALGLDLLDLHISLGGQDVADMSFTSGAAAQAALDDAVVPIDPSLVSGSYRPDLVVEFDVHSSGSEGFLSNFVLMANVKVPEPRFGLVLSIAATLLLLRRRLSACS